MDKISIQGLNFMFDKFKNETVSVGGDFTRLNLVGFKKYISGRHCSRHWYLRTHLTSLNLAYFKPTKS